MPGGWGTWGIGAGTAREGPSPPEAAAGAGGECEDPSPGPEAAQMQGRNTWPHPNPQNQKTPDLEVRQRSQGWTSCPSGSKPCHANGVPYICEVRQPHHPRGQGGQPESIFHSRSFSLSPLRKPGPGVGTPRTKLATHVEKGALRKPLPKHGRVTRDRHSFPDAYSAHALLP